MPTAILALIPARGGSIGIPRKNLAHVGGRPLISWTIEAALRATGITRTVVSTDDEEIRATAMSLGADVPFLRPAHLATSSATTIDVLLDALEWLRVHENYVPSTVVCLQPTSPLRTGVDIDNALARLAESNGHALVSVAAVDHHPLWVKTIDDMGRLHPWQPERDIPPRRQELPAAYSLNGAIYISRTADLIEARTWYGDHTVAFIMPADRSIDIDTPWDLHVADLVLRGKR